MAPTPKQALLKQAAAALATLFDSIAGPDSPVGAIDRIAVARGMLVIDDQKEKRRTVFGGLELAFDKSEGTTTLNVSADGRRPLGGDRAGQWHGRDRAHARSRHP